MTEIIERKPTAEEKAETAAQLKQQQQIAIDEVTALRLHAYQTESDPIFMEAQRDSTRTMEEWKAKVEEIKARYPYPEAPKAN